MKFARESRPFVLPFLAAAAVALAWRHPGWGAAALLAGFLTLLFFRDPDRRPDVPPDLRAELAPAGAGEIVLAPADGLITRVEACAAGGAEETPPELGAGPYHRI